MDLRAAPMCVPDTRKRYDGSSPFRLRDTLAVNSLIYNIKNRAVLQEPDAPSLSARSMRGGTLGRT